jgi:F0F1-type ATP synthase assembly protein I
MLSITELVVTVLVFLFAGRYLDGHLQSGSQFMTIGAIVGFIIGVIRMTIRLKGVMNSSDDQS